MPTRIRAQLESRSPSENTFLVLLPVLGLAVGFTSVAVAHVIAYLQQLFREAIVKFQEVLAGRTHHNSQEKIVIPSLRGISNFLPVIPEIPHFVRNDNELSDAFALEALAGQVANRSD